jgi:hypothetical protein
MSFILFSVPTVSLAAENQYIMQKNASITPPLPQKPTQESPKAIKFLKFYPNPAREFIKFEFTNGYTRGLTFQIVSQIGNKVYDIQNIISRFTIDLQNFNRGVYFFVLKDKTGKVIETGKFQVTK